MRAARVDVRGVGTSCGTILSPGAKLSVGPLFMRRRRGRTVRTGAMALFPGSVAPGPFWRLIHELASETDWLRGTFALSGAAPRRGVLRADQGPPSFSFPGAMPHVEPGLTLLLSGGGVSEAALEQRILRCIESDDCEVNPFGDLLFAS
jgi:hypothetical protein